MAHKVRPRALLLLLTGLNLLNYIDRFVLASLIEQIKAEFTISDAKAGALATAFILGYFLTSPIFGYLGDRMQRRWLIAAGIFVWSLATVLTGYATGYTALILLRVAVGVGEASYATLSPAIISDAFPPARRNMALTFFYSAIPLGAAIGTLFGSWIGTIYSWHYAFIWAGIPGLFLAFSILFFAEPARGESDGPASIDSTENKAGLSEMFKLFRIREYSFAIWGYVAYAFALGAYQYWGQAFLQRIHGIPLHEAGDFFGKVMAVTGLIGTFLGGYLATILQKRSNRGYALLLGYSVLLSLPFSLVFTFSTSTSTAMNALAVAMLLLFMSTGPLNTVILTAVPANQRAAATALSIFCIHAFGDLWSPILVGKISDYFGDLRLGLAILPVALFICAIFWLRIGAGKTAAHQ